MHSRKHSARMAGLLYLLMSLPAPFCLIYIPSFFNASGDATTVANRIRSSEFLFRAGLAAELYAWVMFIFVGLALYHLLQEVHRKQALLMLVLVLVSVPLSLFNDIFQIAALTLASGTPFTSALDQRQLDALAALFLNLHESGFLLSEIFWGLWLFPLGILIYQSHFLPRFLGVLLFPAGFAYLAVVLTTVLFPHYLDLVSRIAGKLQLGELPTILWLMIMGAKNEPPLAVA